MIDKEKDKGETMQVSGYARFSSIRDNEERNKRKSNPESDPKRKSQSGARDTLRSIMRRKTSIKRFEITFKISLNKKGD